MANDRITAARIKEGQVLNLRLAGASFTEIARVVGYANHGGAMKAYDRAMKAAIQEPADKLRALHRLRYDALLKGIWVKAAGGDNWCIDRALAILERMAKLDGLDAPTSVNHTITDAMTAEIQTLAAALGVNDPDVATAP